MTDLTAPDISELNQTIRILEMNGDLLMTELRNLKLKSDQTEATLRLIVGFMVTNTEADDGYFLNRIARHLEACADLPDLAAKMALCEPRCIDPAMIRAVANVVQGGQHPATEMPVLSVGASMH